MITLSILWLPLIFSILARTSVMIVITSVMSECVNILQMMQNFLNHHAQCLI